MINKYDFIDHRLVKCELGNSTTDEKEKAIVSNYLLTILCEKTEKEFTTNVKQIYTIEEETTEEGIVKYDYKYCPCCGKEFLK